MRVLIIPSSLTTGFYSIPNGTQLCVCLNHSLHVFRGQKLFPCTDATDITVARSLLEIISLIWGYLCSSSNGKGLFTGKVIQDIHNSWILGDTNIIQYDILKYFQGITKCIHTYHQLVKSAFPQTYYHSPDIIFKSETYSFERYH